MKKLLLLASALFIVLFANAQLTQNYSIKNKTNCVMEVEITCANAVNIWQELVSINGGSTSYSNSCPNGMVVQYAKVDFDGSLASFDYHVYEGYWNSSMPSNCVNGVIPWSTSGGLSMMAVY